MNDAARDALTDAGLRGHRQIKRILHNWSGGDCAMGVLHLQCHWSRLAALYCYARTPEKVYREVRERFDIWGAERHAIFFANDHRGWDLLTIARKVGTHEEAL